MYSRMADEVPDSAPALGMKSNGVQSLAVVRKSTGQGVTLCPYQLTSVTRFGRKVEKSRPIFPG